MPTDYLGFYGVERLVSPIEQAVIGRNQSIIFTHRAQSNFLFNAYGGDCGGLAVALYAHGVPRLGTHPNQGMNYSGTNNRDSEIILTPHGNITAYSSAAAEMQALLPYVASDDDLTTILEHGRPGYVHSSGVNTGDGSIYFGSFSATAKYSSLATSGLAMYGNERMKLWIVAPKVPSNRNGTIPWLLREEQTFGTVASGTWNAYQASAGMVCEAVGDVAAASRNKSGYAFYPLGKSQTNTGPLAVNSAFITHPDRGHGFLQDVETMRSGSSIVEHQDGQADLPIEFQRGRWMARNAALEGRRATSLEIVTLGLNDRSSGATTQEAFRVALSAICAASRASWQDARDQGLCPLIDEHRILVLVTTQRIQETGIDTNSTLDHCHAAARQVVDALPYVIAGDMRQIVSLSEAVRIGNSGSSVHLASRLAYETTGKNWFGRLVSACRLQGRHRRIA